jgi:asparagine synthase (glutamine-hydrolysing)
MCGIAGINFQGTELVQRMNGAMNHRGPDYSDIFSDENVTLGHTLLAIRDEPKRSQQPVNEDEDPWVLSFNGQIYNTTELARNLDGNWGNESLDTTVLYAVIKKYGWDFIRHIQGMYALAVYNRHEKRLRLYRDASGQKPVYYYCNKAKLIFASEIKAILEDSSIQREPDQEGIQWAARAGFIPSRHTMLEGINKLLPGEMLEWKHGRAGIRLTELDPELPYVESEEGFGGWMRQLVREHLQSRQKVAISLSGGLDSSALLHEMRAQDYGITTYTSYYEDAPSESNSEAALARRLAQDYGTDHHEIKVTKRDYWSRFIRASQIIEEPNYNASNPLYLKMAESEGADGDGIRVLLTGCGGDELFYGYPHHDQNHRIDQWLRMMPACILNRLYQLRYQKKVKFECSIARWAFNREFHEHYLLDSTENMASGELEVEWAQKFLNNYSVSNEGVYNGLLMDRLFFLASENFIRSDKLYMSQSIETRCPFSHTPFRQAVDKATHHLPYHGARSQKAFLRRHYEGRLPDYIIKRKEKVGWHSPLEEWYDEGARDLLLSLFSGRRGPFVDWKKLETKIQKTREWPGKIIHLYASIAVLCDSYGIEA